MLSENNILRITWNGYQDMAAHNYDPFTRGPYPAGVRTIAAADVSRHRVFPCEIWYPAAPEYSGRDFAPETQDEFTAPPRPPHRQMSVRDARACFGTWPLIAFSHPSFVHRRSATYLCTHLASHGYVVAALDHSEVVAPELAWREGATEEEKARIDAIIASRVPDIRVLLDRLLAAALFDPNVALDADRVGIAGHSAGGWTALAAPDDEPRIRAVVALAPGGASNPRPGILPLKLSFKWKRDLPTLLLAAENDATLPLAGMHEIYERIPATKRMVILCRADHAHFMDNAEREHESFRTAPLSPVLEAIQLEMLPSTELTSGEKAHLFTRGLTTCHMDTFLRGRPEARRFLEGDIEVELAAARGRGDASAVAKVQPGYCVLLELPRPRMADEVGKPAMLQVAHPPCVVRNVVLLRQASLYCANGTARTPYCVRVRFLQKYSDPASRVTFSEGCC